MTDWPKELADTIRLAVRGETMVPKDAVFEIEQCVPHGHVQAVFGTINKLGIDNLIASKPCREGRNMPWPRLDHAGLSG